MSPQVVARGERKVDLAVPFRHGCASVRPPRVDRRPARVGCEIG